MTAEWVPPKGDVQLFGTITYVCASCQERIAGPAVFAPLDERGDMTRDTRSYHPDHAPQEVTLDGS